MIIFNQEQLEKYKENDWVLKLLLRKSNPEEEMIRTNEWLKYMDNKRFIYSIVYGDFLKNKTKKKVLDVGGHIIHLQKY